MANIIHPTAQTTHRINHLQSSNCERMLSITGALRLSCRKQTRQAHSSHPPMIIDTRFVPTCLAARAKPKNGSWYLPSIATPSSTHLLPITPPSTLRAPSSTPSTPPSTSPARTPPSSSLGNQLIFTDLMALFRNQAPASTRNAVGTAVSGSADADFGWMFLSKDVQTSAHANDVALASDTSASVLKAEENVADELSRLRMHSSRVRRMMMC
jgi:hypothetical protein